MKLSVDDHCKEQFEALKFRKADIRSVTFVINNEKIFVERVGKKEERWHEFVNTLPEDDFRFCVFDIEFTNSDNMKVSKVVFVNWNPDGVKLKARMIYATSKEAFKSYLDLNGKEFILCSKKDMTQEDMIKEMSK